MIWLRWASQLAVLMVTLAACLPTTIANPSDPASERNAVAMTVQSFVTAIQDNDAETAWAALGKATQREVFDDDERTFATLLAAEPPLSQAWSLTPPVRVDDTWAVFVTVRGGVQSFPQFLSDAYILGDWSEAAGDGVATLKGISVLVEANGEGAYVIQASGLPGT